MSGSLIKLQEVEASSSASITLGDSSWDTSYDVYMVKVNNFHTSFCSYFFVFDTVEDYSWDNL